MWKWREIHSTFPHFLFISSLYIYCLYQNCLILSFSTFVITKSFCSAYPLLGLLGSHQDALPLAGLSISRMEFLLCKSNNGDTL